MAETVGFLSPESVDRLKLQHELETTLLRIKENNIDRAYSALLDSGIFRGRPGFPSENSEGNDESNDAELADSEPSDESESDSDKSDGEQGSSSIPSSTEPNKPSERGVLNI
jgi:hypothetical protein